MTALRWSHVLTLGCALADVEESTSYGTPALKMNGKLMVRLLEPDERGERMVVRVESLEERAAMLATAPRTFEVTPHYEPHPWIIVRLDAIARGLLKEVLVEAHRVVRAQKGARKAVKKTAQKTAKRAAKKRTTLRG